MHPKAILVALGVMLLACTASLAQGQAPSVVLTNPGFEEGLAGWTADLGLKLIEDPRQCHSGARCVFAEVTEPNRHGLLARELDLRTDRVYEVSVWARATNGTKLVLWRSQGPAKREMIQAFENVPAQWRQYTATFTVPEAGRYTLEFIAPSSHGAPPGKMWLDDISFREFGLAANTEVAASDGYKDWPVACATDDGALWCAWIEFANGADTLRVGRGTLQGQELKLSNQWIIEGGPQTYILDPHIATDGKAVWLAYSSERAGDWECFACPLTDQGPGPLRDLSRDRAVDIKPALAVAGDTVLAAWESNRDGSRQIWGCTLRDSELTAPQRLSSLPFNNYAPALAAVGPEDAWLVWHSFRDNNMDLYARRLSALGWSAETRLTRAPIIDREPRLLAARGHYWLAWDNANPREYHIGAAATKRVQIAELTAAALLRPAGADTVAPLRNGEAADLAVDPLGRLWVTCRTPRPKQGFIVSAACFGGERWSDEIRVTGTKGLCRRAPIVMVGDRPVTIFQADTTPGSWESVEASTRGNSVLYFAALDPSLAPSPAAPQLVPYVDSDDVFEAGRIRVERGEDLPGTSIDYEGQRLNLYYGDLHNHTDISICNRTGDQTQTQAYQSMRDIAHYDFAACTDHGYNINAYLWNYLAKIARANNDPGRFLTFLGEEWTSSFEKYDDPKRPYGYYGHRNIILADPYFPLWLNSRDGKTPAEVWEILRANRANFVHIPHQCADTGNVPTDWSFTDETAQPVAEIFQTRGSYEYEGAPRQAKNTTPKGWFLQDAWARGIVIGVIASPDHGGGYGKAAVYAPALTREAILDAIRQRHTYGTTAAKIMLDVRVNGRLMGEKLPPPDGTPVRIDIRAKCPGDIDRVEVCRSNTFIYSPQIEGKECEITFVDNQPPNEPCYYYVRVMQKDGEIAWSSPVWLGRIGPS